MSLNARIAAAPISWGVCEVPGWGHQLSPEVVLAQMRDLGIAATEFGPEGFLPDDAAAKAATLSGYGLAAVGQFVPVVLHDPDEDPEPAVTSAIEAITTAGGSTVVLAAATGLDGYDERPELDEDGWARLLADLDRLANLATRHGLTAALHPHVGTMVETGEDTARVLAGSGIGLCLDTGHLLIGGADPVALAQRYPERIVHVHLKDVDAGLAAQVRDGDLAYTDAVARNLYVPLGRGDVDLAAIVGSLEAAGYSGWYVLEQDTILGAEPADAGPAADVSASIAYLHGLALALAADAQPTPTGSRRSNG